MCAAQVCESLYSNFRIAQSVAVPYRASPQVAARNDVPLRSFPIRKKCLHVPQGGKHTAVALNIPADREP